MLYEVVGWLGTILIVFAYVLATTKKNFSNSKNYQILNLLGALGIIINSFIHKTWSSVGLNIVWLLIAIVGLRKVYSNCSYKNDKN